ncbi:MAG: hypothetical protein WC421_00320 [Elusimicrobiales bacterium]
MIRINLIPPEYLERQEKRTQAARVAGGAVVAAVFFLGLTAMHIESAVRAEKELRVKEAELKERAKTVAVVNELETSRNALKSHLDALNGLLSSRYYYPLFMRGITRELSQTVWFSMVSTQLKDGGKIDFGFNCAGRSGEDVAAWLSRMEAAPEYSNVTVGPIALSNGRDGQTLSLSVKGTYQSPAVK